MPEAKPWLARALNRWQAAATAQPQAQQNRWDSPHHLARTAAAKQ